MGKIEYPFIDPRTALDDPFRPGTKLCPRCSKRGNVCCSVKPAIEVIRGQPVVVLGIQAADLPQKEDDGRYLWVCSGGCDRNGVHPDPSR